MVTGYSDNCIRGIRKADWIDDGVVTSMAFYPNYNIIRDDQGYEMSINWEDDSQVVNFTLNQSTSIFGAARLPRKVIDSANELYQSRNCLTYERNIIANNPYHGNIVYRAQKSIIKMIAGTLALGVTEVFQPNRPS